MMCVTQLGSKTQLGTYIENHYNFCVGLLANTSHHPGLASVSKCG